MKITTSATNDKVVTALKRMRRARRALGKIDQVLGFMDNVLHRKICEIGGEMNRMEQTIQEALTKYETR